MALRPRHRVVLALVALLIGLGATSPLGGEAASTLCGQRNPTVLERAGRSIVVEVANPVARGSAIYGCFAGLRYQGRPRFYLLGENDPGRDRYGVRTRVFGIAGRYVAYASEAATGEGDHGLVLVRDLATGRVRYVDPVDRPVARVAAVVLVARGSVAWIERGPAYAVHVHDIRGPRVLDSGASILPRSLRVRGSQLIWAHGGLRRHASLG